MTEIFDVLVLGGGPAGLAAARAARAVGARVALIEHQRVGGSCLNESCIPSHFFTDVAAVLLKNSELAAQQVIDETESFRIARAGDRQRRTVEMAAAGVAKSLEGAGVELLYGSAQLLDGHHVSFVDGTGTRTSLWSEAIVLATGATWATPRVRDVTAAQLVTVDHLQRSSAVPNSVVVIGGGPSKNLFALEYATALAVMGAATILALPGERVIDALDADLDGVLDEALDVLGVQVRRKAVTATNGEARLDAELVGSITAETLVVWADARVPTFDPCGSGGAGVELTENGWVLVDESAQTTVSSIYAAGDITGGCMLSSSAESMGAVAGANAAGAHAVVLPERSKGSVSGPVELAWVGNTEASASLNGSPALTGAADLSTNGLAIAQGGFGGYVKIIASGRGALLGCHAVGHDATGIVTTADALIQAGVSIEQLAGMQAWHPSALESLREAARAASPR